MVQLLRKFAILLLLASPCWAQVLSTCGAESSILVCESGNWVARTTGNITFNSNSVPVGNLRPARVCYMDIDGGTGTAGVVASGDSLVSKCFNDFGSTLTVIAVRCFTDNSGSTTVLPKITGGPDLLSGALTCSSSWASGTLSGTPTLTAGSTFDMVATPDGSSKLLHVEITLQ